MAKKITLIILILLCCVVGYSQSRRPKNTKKPTIQDVITEKKIVLFIVSYTTKLVSINKKRLSYLEK